VSKALSVLKSLNFRSVTLGEYGLLAAFLAVAIGVGIRIIKHAV
jgi:hypothetical protein